jgi:hypothetical protein
VLARNRTASIMLNTVLRLVKQAPIGKLALEVGDFAIRDGRKMAPWAIPAAIAGIEASVFCISQQHKTQA